MSCQLQVQYWGPSHNHLKIKIILKFINFCVAHLPVLKRNKKKTPVLLILDVHVRNEKSGISSLYLTLKLVNAQHKN